MPHPLVQAQLMQAAILQQAMMPSIPTAAEKPKAYSPSKPHPLIDKSKCITLKLRLPQSPGMAGLTLRDDKSFGLPILIDVHQLSPLREQVPESLRGNYWIVSINDFAIRTSAAFANELRACQRPDREVTVDVTLCRRGNDALAPEGTRESSEAEEKELRSLGVLRANDAERTAKEGKSSEKDGALNGGGNAGTDDAKGEGETKDGEADLFEEEDDGNPHNHTQEERDRIRAIERESLKLFPYGRKDIIYDNAKALMDAYNEQIAHKYGFKLENRGSSFRCSRCDAAPKKLKEVPDDKKRTRRTARCGCGFKMNHSYADKELMKTAGKRGCPVYLTNCNYRHSNGCSGLLPKILTKKEEEALEREARGARKLKRKTDENRPKCATEMIEQFRPMFRSLGRVQNPQQKRFLRVLEGVQDLIEGTVAEQDVAAASTAAAKAAANAAAEEEEEEEGYDDLMA